MIRVLVVDDSALVRRVLRETLSAMDGIEVVGAAVDAYAARDMIVALSPDVVTLDIEMPRLDGLSFLKKLMRYHPLPVVIVSSVAPERSETAIAALRLGAVDVVGKPDSPQALAALAPRLKRAIAGAALARLSPATPHPQGAPGEATPDQPESRGAAVSSAEASPAFPAPSAATEGSPALPGTGKALIAIGASTGGTRAVERVLRGLSGHCPGILIVQHMPRDFTTSFARSLDAAVPLTVREARDGDCLQAGTALVAPGDRHLLCLPSGDGFIVQLKDGPPVHFQKPSVDVLFDSVARSAGAAALGILLTGMGRDGARGLLAMRRAGSLTFAQDEASCVVFGMPKEAIRLQAAERVLPLDEIAAATLRACALPTKKTELPV